MAIFTLASFNICSAHFREGHYTEDNLVRLADCIRESTADVICLQEVDRGAARSECVDMPARLAELSNLKYHYFIKIRDFQGGEYGTAVLSRYPILNSATMNYPVRIATQGTSCGYVVIDINGVPVTVFNTHLSIENEESNTETLVCLGDVLKKHVDAGKGAFLCCGDFNTSPTKVAAYIPWASLAHNGLTTYADRSIDHILYVSPISVSNTRTMDTQVDGVTDHNMVLTDVTV
jgi:endonuclease/exonuclease/phosphatase family metal-dependent hydrolase